MYEHPSIQLELVKHRHAELVAEAERSRLASEVQREPSEALSVLRSLVASLKRRVARRPVVVGEPRLEPIS